MKIEISPTARRWRFGDNIDTDVLYPGKFMTLSAATSKAALVGLSALDPSILDGFAAGDVVIAGTNFGCGSSREYAPAALRDLGVPVVVAKSFARIFYRNAFNIGLPLVECHDVDKIPADGPLSIDLLSGTISTDEQQIRASPTPQFLCNMVEGGGLMSILRARLAVARDG